MLCTAVPVPAKRGPQPWGRAWQPALHPSPGIPRPSLAGCPSSFPPGIPHRPQCTPPSIPAATPGLPPALAPQLPLMPLVTEVGFQSALGDTEELQRVPRKFGSSAVGSGFMVKATRRQSRKCPTGQTDSHAQSQQPASKQPASIPRAPAQQHNLPDPHSPQQVWAGTLSPPGPIPGQDLRGGASSGLSPPPLSGCLPADNSSFL